MKSKSSDAAPTTNNAPLRMPASDACRHGQHRICDKRKQGMKQPVLEDGSVSGLRSHPSNHDGAVHDATGAHQSPEYGDDADAMPRR